MEEATREEATREEATREGATREGATREENSTNTQAKQDNSLQPTETLPYLTISTYQHVKTKTDLLLINVCFRRCFF